MTMTLELSEELQLKLQKAAARQQISPQDVLLKLVDKYLENDAEQLSEERFRTLAQGVIDDNRELLERLA